MSDALELVARALRAGHSLAAGMHVVAELMLTPIADEFNRVYEEQNLGIGIDDSLRGMCERVPNLDLRFFVTSVLIQRQTGGDLAEILDKIGYVIRERYRILGQVQLLRCRVGGKQTRAAIDFCASRKRSLDFAHLLVMRLIRQLARLFRLFSSRIYQRCQINPDFSNR